MTDEDRAVFGAALDGFKDEWFTGDPFREERESDAARDAAYGQNCWEFLLSLSKEQWEEIDSLPDIS